MNTPHNNPIDNMTEADLFNELIRLIQTSKNHSFSERKQFRIVATKLKSLGFKLIP